MQCKNGNADPAASINRKAIDIEPVFQIPTKNIVLLLKEGCGIRSISRILQISATTVIKRILFLAASIKRPLLHFGKIYEMDEIRTFIGRKSNLRWIPYAIERVSGNVVAFNVGNRSNKTLQSVIDTLLLAKAQIIHTDKLKNYKYLIPAPVHSTKYRATNGIERHNLTMRTHLKRLTRRSICFSKNEAMLTASFAIYLWC